MPDFRSFFDYKWVRAWDLGGREVTVVIERVEAGILENKQAKKRDKAPILYLRGAKKPLALNKTNAKTIAGLYGNNTDAWIGKSITIYPTRTTFGPDEVDCIRVRPQVPKGKAEDMPNPAPPPGASEDNNVPEAAE